MPEPRQYGRVRVRLLVRPAGDHDDWGFNLRPPRAGDVGYVVDILPGSGGGPAGYAVESAGPDGVTVWLGTFAAEELEPVD